MTKKKKLNSHKFFTIDEKLAAMKILVANEMNHYKTAQQLGISKVTMYKWSKQYLKEFRERQADIEENMVTVEAKKLMLYENTNKLSEKTIKLFELMINFFLDNEGTFDKLNDKDKVQLINVITPYVLEKKGVMGTFEPKPSTQNNFFTNIINELKNRDGDNNSTNKRYSPATIITED